MKRLLPHSLFFVTAIYLSCLPFAAAQQIPAEKPDYTNAAVDGRQGKIASFRERELGWVSGRIYDITSDEAQPLNVADVKVVLRSSEQGFGSFIREQVSNEAGVYDFHNLGAGEYTVEIDTSSLPAKYRLNGAAATSVSVKPLSRSYVNLPILPQRIITGKVFIDADGDGKFTPGKDTTVRGASIAANGAYATSDTDGAYVLRDLPAGRVGLLVSLPHKADTTHVVLDIGSGPVTNRVVNVPLNP